MFPTMLRDSQTHHECLMDIYNTLNTTPTENLNHDYLQQLFQRHIERMKYKERLNNEMVHTEIKKDECPMYVEAQAKWVETMKERLQVLSDVLDYPTTRVRENSVEKYSILALWDKHCELDINSIGHFISAEELRPLIKPLQKQRPSLNLNELLEYFQPLLGAATSDETEEQVLTSCDHGRVRKLLQTRGCSNENRLRLWSLVLGLSSSADNEIRYEYVRRLIFNYDCLMDKFLFKDIRTRASNDDQFFVFEDEIFQILLAFQRETLSDNLTSLSSSMILPSIVLAAPSALVAPVCFVTSSIADVFHIFSTLAKRYFTYLTRLTSNTNGIVNIFHVFHSILLLLKPKLLEYLLPITVEEEMLEVLLCAFAGPLAADQVLVLWDAMIGFDSTLVLALLAVGVVITRQKTLEACENRSQLRVSCPK
ncbi:TBC1 domain family member 19-like isoform X1 [Varroa jacobsoni]|uniref:TBC1 domain family member 19-like isoform X1 n=1 Tax=Varroa jacobsoni TaxID=62625 RepID=UPI000BF42E3E|nr:TBC1 domain family member 19-like isoform X1 [Varroa jacobsoni]